MKQICSSRPTNHNNSMWKKSRAQLHEQVVPSLITRVIRLYSFPDWHIQLRAQKLAMME